MSISVEVDPLLSAGMYKVRYYNTFDCDSLEVAQLLAAKIYTHNAEANKAYGFTGDPHVIIYTPISG